MFWKRNDLNAGFQTITNLVQFYGGKTIPERISNIDSEYSGLNSKC